MLIPYGADNWPVERLQDLAAAPVAGFPLADARLGVMLRINRGALDLPPLPPTEADVPMPGRITTHLKRLSGGWNKAAGLFVDRYFAFLDIQIERNRAALNERLARFDGLFRAEDFLYSAPLALPQAYLMAEPSEFVKVDFAFWLGDRVVAVLLAPSALTPMAARRRRERLAAAGIEVAEATAAQLKDQEFHWFEPVLGRTGTRFWEGVALPSSPSTPKLLDF
jgi:hypothetical protein